MSAFGMTKKEIIAVLKKARETIRPRKKWTQGAWARTADGVGVPSRHTGAVCYCVMGAVKANMPPLAYSGDVETYLNKFIPKSKTPADIYTYNDHRSHRSVMRLLDRAIGG